MIKKSIEIVKLIVKAANILLALVLVGVACALAYIAVPAFGNRALIVRSGSMQPTIKAGDLVVVKKQVGFATPQFSIPKYKTEDIVAFRTTDGKTLVTHRVKSVKIENGKVFYETKGDANGGADKNLVLEENIVGKSVFEVPSVGKLIAFTKSNIGFPLLVIFPAILVIIFEIWGIFKEIKRQRRIIEVPPEKSHAISHLAVILPICVSVLVIHSTFAYFCDQEVSTSNVFVASTSFASPSPSPSPSPSASPSPSPTPNPGEPFADDVVAVSGTFGHCCSDLSSDPLVAKALVTGAPDSPPNVNFIQISDNSAVTLKFVDNKALPSGNSNPDIRIYVYDALFSASAEIFVSDNCVSFTSVGVHADTANVDLDIDPTGLPFVKCVKLVDQVAGGDPYPTLGFDLDAMQALNSVADP